MYVHGKKSEGSSIVKHYTLITASNVTKHTGYYSVSDQYSYIKSLQQCRESPWLNAPCNPTISEASSALSSAQYKFSNTCTRISVKY